MGRRKGNEVADDSHLWNVERISWAIRLTSRIQRSCSSVTGVLRSPAEAGISTIEIRLCLANLRGVEFNLSVLGVNVRYIPALENELTKDNLTLC